MAAAFCCARIAESAPPPRPAAVAASIRSIGARKTIETLIRDDRWEGVTDAMNRGATAWIALAPALAPGSDAGSAEDLGLSLAFALPRNPRAVLAAIDPRDGHILGATRICGRPFIEDTEPKDYKRKALAALSTVTAPGLIGIKRVCIEILRAH